MSSHAEPTPPTELTRSPQINQLLRAVDALRQGTLDGETLNAVLQETQNFLTSLSHMVDEQLKMSAPSPALETHVPRVREAIGSAQTSFQALADAALGSDAGRLDETVVDMRIATARMFETFDALQSDEAKEPPLSKSPALNHLMKVGFAVADGHVDAAVFKPLLESLLAHSQQISASLKVAASPGEEALLATRRDELESASRNFIIGLQEAERYFEDGDPTHIRNGLQMANQASEKLLELQDAFAAAEAAGRSRQCVRCGAENDVQSRQCQKCNAMLPTVLSGMESTVDVRVDEQIQSSQHIMTDTTQQLVNVVAAIQSGRLMIWDIVDTLQGLEKKMRKAREDLDAMNPQEQASTQEELDLLLQAHEMMDLGLREMQEGIDAMRLSVNQNNPANLDVGMEAFLTGADKVAQVQMAAMGQTTGG